MLVMQNGRIVSERYSNSGMREGRWPIFSGTKNFWGIAALCAVRDHVIQLDDRVADTITEWKTDVRKSQITVRQLLNQTDGIEAAPFLHRESIRDRNAMAIQLPSLATPGASFIYGPSHFQILAELLRRRLIGRSLTSYLEQNVTGPLGLGGLKFKKDGRGNPLPASGFELSAGNGPALGELDTWQWKLSRAPNSSGFVVARSLCRLGRKSVLWPDLLAEPTSTARARSTSKRNWIGPGSAHGGSASVLAGSRRRT